MLQTLICRVPIRDPLVGSFFGVLLILGPERVHKDRVPSPRHWPVTGVNVELEAEEHQKETKPESKNLQMTKEHRSRPESLLQKKNEERHDLPGWLAAVN